MSDGDDDIAIAAALIIACSDYRSKLKPRRKRL